MIEKEKLQDLYQWVYQPKNHQSMNMREQYYFHYHDKIFHIGFHHKAHKIHQHMILPKNVLRKVLDLDYSHPNLSHYLMLQNLFSIYNHYYQSNIQSL